MKLSNSSNKLRQSDRLQKILTLGTLVLMFIIFSFASPNFLKFDNIISILLATSVNGILAIGATFIIITGGIDLSVGTVMTLSGVMTGVFIVNLGLPIALGVILGILVGAVLGLFNGFFVAKMNIPPFIATLGMQMMTKGLSLIISGSKPIYFSDIEAYNKISMTTVFGVPTAIIIFLVLAIIAHLILSGTILGRYNYALGSNEQATRLSGINTVNWKLAIYTLGGIFSGIAGVVLSSRLNSAQPAIGVGYETDAIAAAVIGGASLSGGEGSISGTVIGAFIITVLTNGLRILSVPQEWQTVVTGAIVIGAVYFDILRRKKRR